ncbi:MAG: type IV toxin-antitoxin system AbiEi family antitoxin domain-containing protein [Candidatus Aminicenantes bacterium]|nr:type IV toxin-antitoxin system AbiEi family antitoxin domain-containing protein [Candidatus Aminicenantes bacterium]
MKWEELLQIVGKESVFSSNLLKTGDINPVDLSKQLSRWVESGKLVQVRRGLYALSERYRKTDPHPFYIANRTKRASYVSLQSALEHYSLIPEYVPAVTSVTTGRPQTFETPLGNFIFRHIKKELFFNYILEELTTGQSVFIATPEKALLDLLYLTPGSDDPVYLKELRLQNIENLNIKRFQEIARRAGSPKLIRASKILENLVKEL